MWKLLKDLLLLPTKFGLDMGGGGGEQTTTSTTTNIMYSPEEAAKRAELFQEARNQWLATKDKYGPGLYPGPRPVPWSEDTIAARQSLRNTIPHVENTLQNLRNAINFGLGPALYVESNPALQNAIAAAIHPITQAYMDPSGVFSNIRTEATNAGQYGGTRQGIAEGVAGSRYLREVGDVASKLASEGYLQGLNTFARVLNATPQSLTAQSLPSLWLSGLGLQSEQAEQEREAYAAAQRQWDMQGSWIPLQNYANIVMGLGPSRTQTTATATAPQPEPDPFSQILGLGLTAYSLFSDGGLLSKLAKLFG